LPSALQTVCRRKAKAFRDDLDRPRVPSITSHSAFFIRHFPPAPTGRSARSPSARRGVNLPPQPSLAGVKVSFIIPLFNRLDLTLPCVESLRATLPRGLPHEIILVDDGSTDGTRDWLRTLGPPFRVLLNDRNLGYAASNNRGAGAATGNVLALVNSDLVFVPGWLPPMLRTLRWRPWVGIVGNVQVNALTGALDHTGIVVDEKCKPVHDLALPRFSAWRPVRRVPAVTAACVLVRRRQFLRLGGFDEEFRNGGEDVDFCFRLRATGRGVRVALPSLVRHHISASPGRKEFDEYNSRRLALKWSDEFARLTARPWCWEYLAKHWREPRDFDRKMALRALFFLAGLAHWPPEPALARQRAVLAVEEARWGRLLGPAPAVGPGELGD
jgi:GT2 family glycosyltransferase